MSVKTSKVFAQPSEQSTGIPELIAFGRGAGYATKKLWYRLRGKKMPVEISESDLPVRVSIDSLLAAEIPPIHDEEEYAQLCFVDLGEYIVKMHKRNPVDVLSSDLIAMLWSTVVKWFMPPPGRMTAFAQQRGFYVTSTTDHFTSLVTRVLYMTGFYECAVAHADKAVSVVSRAIDFVLGKIKPAFLRTVFGAKKKDHLGIMISQDLAGRARNMLDVYRMPIHSPLIEIGRPGKLQLYIGSSVAEIPVLATYYRSDGFLVFQGQTPEAEAELVLHGMKEIDPSRVSPRNFGYEAEVEVEGPELLALRKRFAVIEEKEGKISR